MFGTLSNRLHSAFRTLTGKAEISEANISEALAEVRKALIEADVALPVVRSFIDRVKEESLGVKVNDRLTPEQQFIEIIYEALKDAMGKTNAELNLRAQPPAVILMAGLQGAGKTTSVAKLARLLKGKKKKVLVVSCDVYRPAAIQQLQTLAYEVEVDFYPSQVGQNPVEIATNALTAARKAYYDVLIVDTAGRLHVDDEMMAEIKQIHAAIKPIETLFTVDAMTGQDAANTAKAFDEALPLSGVILTKLDGDVRGGAALSIREITGKPIKFLGVGEKTDALEPFHPDRMASRILDMGDFLTLIEKIKGEQTEEELKAKQKKLLKKDFDLEDYLEAMGQMDKMGSVDGIMKMLPGANAMADKIDTAAVTKQMNRQRAIISSMTPKERKDPKLLKHTRKLRIAQGAGASVQEINQLLEQFEQMRKMQKMLKDGSLMRALGGMGGLSKMLGGMAGGMGGLGSMMGQMGGMFGGGRKKR